MSARSHLRHTVGAMSRRSNPPFSAAGIGLVTIALCLLTWQQFYLASSVRVMGRVVDTRCSPACRPVIAFQGPDGVERQMNGQFGGTATTFEMNEEWMEVLVPSHNPGDASVPAELPTEYGLELGLLVAGLAIICFLWAGRVELPVPHSAAPWGVRGAAALVGGAGLAVGHWVAPVRDAWTFGCMAVAAVVVAVPVVYRFIRSRGDAAPQPAALCYTLGSMGLIAGLGTLVVPSAMRPGLLACAPLAVIVTLPLQFRLWPTVERALVERAERAKRRRRLEAAMVSTGPKPKPEIIVRVQAVQDTHLELLRRVDGADEALWALPDAFGSRPAVVDEWFLVVGPVFDERPSPTGGGYRTAALTAWLVQSADIERLGPDIDRALAEQTDTPFPARVLAVSTLGGLALAVAGGWALVDRLPPLSGPPLPPTALLASFEHPRSLAGVVASVEGWPGPQAGDACTVTVSPASSDHNCSLSISCAGHQVYGGGTKGFTRCLTSAQGDLLAHDTSYKEGDPSLRLDTRTAKADLQDGPTKTLTIQLTPP